jgi:hypothetical protein
VHGIGARLPASIQHTTAATMSDSAKRGKGVRVMVRVRPMLPREYQFDQAAETPSETSVKLHKDGQCFESTYDNVFPEGSTQDEVYSDVQGGPPLQALTAQ